MTDRLRYIDFSVGITGFGNAETILRGRKNRKRRLLFLHLRTLSNFRHAVFLLFGSKKKGGQPKPPAPCVLASIADEGHRANRALRRAGILDHGKTAGLDPTICRPRAEDHKITAIATHIGGIGNGAIGVRETGVVVEPYLAANDALRDQTQLILGISSHLVSPP